jgi:hypothetical protein
MSRRAYLVRERDATSRELAAERVSSIGRCTVSSDARVPEDALDLQEIEASIGIADEYRAAIEEKAHG